MKRFLAALVILVSVVLVGLAVWGRFRRVEPALAPELAFPRPGVAEVRTFGATELIEIHDDAGRLVARAETYGRPVTEVLFPWKPGASYRVVADGERGATQRAPAAAPEFIVRLHAPLGQTPHEEAFGRPYGDNALREIAVPAGPGEKVDVMLEIERLADGEPIAFDVGVKTGDDDSSAVRMEPAIEEDGATLEFEFDKIVGIGQLHLGDRLPESPVVITVRTGEFVLPLGLRLVSRKLDEEDLAIEWRLPTEADGFHERRRVADRISMPSRFWIGAAGWFGIRPEMPSGFVPFTYQTLWIENRSDQPVSLLLVSDILHPESGEPVEHFAAPEFESTGGMGRIMAYSHVGPGQRQACVLPVYVRPDTPEGTYLRRVEIKPLGSDRTLKVLEAPLGVVRSNLVFSGWVTGVAVLSLVWLVGVFVSYRRIVESLGIRVLVLLALLGSLQFCLQFVGGLVSMVFYALLGPFNCLVGGLLTEVMTYLLVTSILFLVPRVGAMTLAGLVTYVMGGVLFGSFGLTDVLFVGSAIAFREVFLLGFGVTRFGPPGAKPPNLVAMMLALGLADAASTFTSLALQAVFYRLFFAEWYIVLQVGVTGFLYTALGVYLGRSLGMNLRKVHQ